MAEVLIHFSDPVRDAEGVAYTAQAVGRVGDDDLWEGWLEFIPADEQRRPALRTARETTQPNRTDLKYWASGLTMIYLEGALRRAKAPTHTARRTTVEAAPRFSEPAPDVVRDDGVRARPVLDPFAVYAQGEDVLRQELSALSADHLRTILRAYAPRGEDAEAASEAALRERILAMARSAAAGSRPSALGESSAEPRPPASGAQ